MRFMMMVKLPSDLSPEDYAPTPEMVESMTKYNHELGEAGILLALDGLHPATEGARLEFGSGEGKPTVIDGPYTEAKEIIGGYWILDVSSLEEAVEWASRAPMGKDGVLELRRVFDMEDHSEEVRAAAQA